ncbi:MAG TPA: hypothetical protein VK157_14690 [Phycisphaerales bacterium]|nr:hypothetical protein [Phycisphaerales bacterium]
MPTLPRERGELLSWLLAHVPVWQARAGVLGLSALQIEQVSAEVEQLHQAIVAQEEARAAAEAATQTVERRDREVRLLAANLMRVIRAKASTENNPEVLQAAQIPAIAPRRPVAAPGTPTTLDFALGSAGTLTLTWTAKHPRGSDRVVYLVKRQLPGEAGFTLLGATGERAFDDTTLPAGIADASYTVQAMRGKEASSESLVMTVYFGAGGRANEQTSEHGAKQQRAAA